MGHWGYEPNQGDNALDDWYDVQFNMAKSLDRFYRYNPDPQDAGTVWSRLGVIQSALESNLWVLKSTVVAAISDCDDLLGDEDFLKSWRNPGLAREAVTELRRVFEDLLRSSDHLADVSLRYTLDRETVFTTDFKQHLADVAADDQKRRRNRKK